MPSIFHEPAIELAVQLNSVSKTKFESAPNDLLRDAMFALNVDAVRVHRAVGCLADGGWPAQGASLLRTLIDITISAIAVVNSQSPRMAAFRYFYSGFRRAARDQSFSRTFRQAMFDQMKARIASLPENLRSEALAVVKEKDRAYWYAEEFASPSAVIERFGTPDIRSAYAQLSGCAHGGFMGSRLFRERPDSYDINPENAGPRALSIDLISCRLLAEFLLVREGAEGLGMGAVISEFSKRVCDAAVSAPPAV
jgi:hypothetical protein